MIRPPSDRRRQRRDQSWGASKRRASRRRPKARAANTFEAGLRGEYAANAKLLAERDQHKVVTIRFFGWTPSAIPKPRFGVATKFHGAARTIRPLVPAAASNVISNTFKALVHEAEKSRSYRDMQPSTRASADRYYAIIVAD